MNELFETIPAIPAITVLCLAAAEVLKIWTPLDNKHLPALCGVLGLVLGVASYIGIPGYLPAENVIVAAAIGAVSGWAATGMHQAFKQYTRE